MIWQCPICKDEVDVPEFPFRHCDVLFPTEKQYIGTKLAVLLAKNGFTKERIAKYVKKCGCEKRQLGIDRAHRRTAEQVAKHKQLIKETIAKIQAKRKKKGRA